MSTQHTPCYRKHMTKITNNTEIQPLKKFKNNVWHENFASIPASGVIFLSCENFPVIRSSYKGAFMCIADRIFDT